jgi:dimethylhistidine N-methyltransferase/ergothioneine biosynthesis protein EgtC
MCRHFAYLGERVPMSALLLDPPHSLAEQAWAPRRQAHGTMNVDGFGIGWYADGDPIPARYRQAGPIWADETLPDLARVIHTHALLGAVRSASGGTDHGAAAAAPYAAGKWLFSLNGALAGWSAAAGSAGVSDAAAADGVLRLARTLSAADLLGLQARCDAALIWAIVQVKLQAGEGPGDALAATVADVAEAGASGRLNLLLTDGNVIAATAAGDTLCYRRDDAGVIVASEPFDDDPGWLQVPDASLLEATPDAVAVRPLQPAPLPGPGPAGVMIDRRLPERFFETSLRADVQAGLTSSPKSLPPKWFYDERGSELFDKITRLDEYYPTRAEREILVARAGEIAAATGAATLVELGSGSGDKTRLLLDALREAGTLAQYVPVDVSESALVAAAIRMRERYPGLRVSPVLSDFTEHLGLSGRPPRLIVFLGGTIGNMLPAERAEFLADVRAGMDQGDALLLGTDLVKDPAVLVAAYDDAAGVTAAFNKNILAVLNAELGATFDLDEFEHVAIWDAAAEWIEMRLRSNREQTVLLPALGLSVGFAPGEEMRTEISAKFRREGVASELAAAGLELRRWWTDGAGRFGLSLSVPARPLT